MSANSAFSFGSIPNPMTLIPNFTPNSAASFAATAAGSPWQLSAPSVTSTIALPPLAFFNSSPALVNDDAMGVMPEALNPAILDLNPALSIGPSDWTMSISSQPR